VRQHNGTPVAGEVVTYTVRSPEAGLRISPEYASHVICGLRTHDAPEDYVAYVKERIIVNNPDLAAQVGRL